MSHQDQDRNRRFAEDYINRLAQYPDGAALILRVADAIRSAGARPASAPPTTVEVPQSNEQSNPQTSTTTADGWEF